MWIRAAEISALLMAAALFAAMPAAAQESQPPAAAAQESQPPAAAAQESQPPAAAPTSASRDMTSRPASYLGQPKDTYQVFVFGDSLAAGMFAGMARMAEGDLRLSIDGRFKDDSGLTRPEFYDWASALPKVLERREIDIAVIFLGANDGQDIRTSAGSIVFRTPDWATTYADRIDRIIDVLRQRGTAIYWTELPPMGPEPLEEEARYIATIHRDRAQKAKIRFVETRPVFADADDRYTDQGIDSEGRQTRLRTKDGIHFLKAGNNRLGEIILAAIRKDIDIADGKPRYVFVSPHDDDPLPAASNREVEKEKPRLPLFGQAAGSKEEADKTVFTADPLWAAAVLAITSGVDLGVGKSDSLETPFTALIGLRQRVAPESSAGQLLIKGQWPKVEPGRFDDFSWSSR
jgi:hypothetical protein